MDTQTSTALTRVRPPRCLRVVALCLLSLPLTACEVEAPRAGTIPVAGGGTTDGIPPPARLVHVPDPRSGDNALVLLQAGPRPEPGTRWRDPAFGTVMARVTTEPGIRHEYARFDPFNADGSMIILLRPEAGDRLVFRTATIPYDDPENLVAALDVEEPRWDPADPDLVWGLDDLRIVTIDCRTGRKTTVKDFAEDPRIGPLVEREPDLYRVTTRDEGESSRDMRFWALLLQGTQDDHRLRYLFTWDRETDRVLGVHPLSRADEIDWVGMSWHGTWVIVGGDPGPGELAGLVIGDRALTRFHRLAHNSAHSDVGLDLEGREVIVMQNTATDRIDLIPLDWSTTPVGDDDRPYAGTNRTPLVRLFYSSDSPRGMNAGVHISANTPGYCVVSTYLEAGIRERNWLDRSIVVVALDAKDPRAAYLAKVHNTCGTYWEETHATITGDGSRVVWASNWGQDVGESRTFLVQLDMPDAWQEQLEAHALPPP